MNLAENESNNNNKIIADRLKIKSQIKIVNKTRIIIIILLVVVLVVLVPAIIKDLTINEGKQNPNDPKNGPAAANEFINNVYIDENGKLRLEKSIGEFWDEMKQKGNALTKYLNSSQELAKLFSASIATDYPDTRENPDDPIDWNKLDLDTNSTDVQGIIKFKRALSSGDKITMTYLPSSEFQKKIDKYNETGKIEDRDEAMKYFTLEKSIGSENSSTGDTNFIQDETTMTIDFANIICAGRAKEKLSAHGDITMIGSDGHYLLIDTSESYLRKSVIQFLKEKNYADKEFDILISHNHSDHWGNAEYLMKNYKIGTLYLPEGNEAKYSSLERAAKNRRINVKRLKQNDTFNIGKAKLEVLYNPHNEIKNNNSVINNKSLITRISVPTLDGKEIRFLTCGDAEKLIEKELLKKGIDLKADIFKLNHHCMNTSNTDNFIDAIQPKYTVSNWWQDTSKQFPRTESTEGVKNAGKYGIVYSVIYNNGVKFSVSNHGVIIPEIYDNKEIVPYVFKDKQGNVIGTFNLQIPRDSHVRSYNPKKELNEEQLQALTQYFSDYAGSGGVAQNTNETQNVPEGAKVITLDVDYSNIANNNRISYNNDKFDVENIVDVVKITGYLGIDSNKAYSAIQSGCFDGKHYICALNKKDGNGGYSGGRVIWINPNTNKVDYTLDIGSECGHMEGMTYDSYRKVVLLPCSGQKHLLQIDNKTKSVMSTKYIETPEVYGKLAYSVTRNQLIALERHHKQFVFLTYDGTKYVEKDRVKLNFTNFTNVQGISSDGQVVFISDSRQGSTQILYTFDYNGNKVEEHLMGDGFTRNSKEVENCFADKDGNLILCLPHMIAKVKGYKARPVDWENNYSPTRNTNAKTTTNTTTNKTTNTATNTATTGDSSKVQELLKYACSWVGKIGYKSGANGPLREGGRTDCGAFVFRVYERFGLMYKHITPKNWKNGAPGTIEIGNDLSKASPGDITWRKGSDGRCHVSIYLGKGKRVHSTPGHRNKYCKYF